MASETSVSRSDSLSWAYVFPSACLVILHCISALKYILLLFHQPLKMSSVIGWLELFIALLIEAQLPYRFLNLSKDNLLMFLTSGLVLPAVSLSQLMENLY